MAQNGDKQRFFSHGAISMKFSGCVGATGPHRGVKLFDDLGRNNGVIEVFFRNFGRL